MPNLITPPKLLDSTQAPANGTIAVRVTASFGYAGDIITTVPGLGQIVGGEFKNAAGDGPLVLPTTPALIAVELVAMLVEHTPEGVRKVTIRRTVSVPAGVSVTWDDLVDMVPVIVSGEYIVPPWIADLLTARDEAVAAATAAETARAAAVVAKDAAVVAKDAAEAVPATTDGLMTTIDANSASAYRVQADARQYATFARDRIIDANKQGVKADGVTDDAAAWQAILNAAPVGSVITWTGRSILKSAIRWRTGVSLVGQGRGKSVLATVDSTGTLYFSAIEWIPYDGASAINPLTDCTFRDFEIDGSGLAGTANNIAAKGIFAQWLIRCQFLNLYIHDTIGTGLGTDFMPECLIDGVLAERNGRNYTGVGGGCAGIGIGTGAWEEEPLTIANCHAKDNGNWGIFVEYQETEPYRGRGARIIGCTTNGNRVGIGDRGTAGTVIMGNVSYANVRDGITVSYGARDGIISGNIIYKNVREGVAFNNDSRNPYTVTKNRIFENTLRGVYVPNATSPFSGLTITDNEIYRNGLHGVELSGFAPGGFSNPIVSRNRVFDNGQAAASRGFLFDCSASGFTIDANDVYDTQTVKTQTVAFKFSDSAAQTLVNGSVDGNKLAESVTPFSLGSAVRTNVSIQRNTGYATRTSGSGTLAIGAAAADFNHGLASGLTPTVVTLTPRGEGVNLYTNNRTGVIFRAARVGATTTALVFDWTAEA